MLRNVQFSSSLWVFMLRPQEHLLFDCGSSVAFLIVRPFYEWTKPSHGQSNEVACCGNLTKWLRRSNVKLYLSVMRELWIWLGTWDKEKKESFSIRRHVCSCMNPFVLSSTSDDLKSSPDFSSLTFAFEDLCWISFHPVPSSGQNFSLANSFSFANVSMLTH